MKKYPLIIRDAELAKEIDREVKERKKNDPKMTYIKFFTLAIRREINRDKRMNDREVEKRGLFGLWGRK
jgi:hypothetical protein